MYVAGAASTTTVALSLAPVETSLVTVVPVPTGPLYPLPVGNATVVMSAKVGVTGSGSTSATTVAGSQYTGVSAGVRNGNGCSWVVGVVTVLVGLVMV